MKYLIILLTIISGSAKGQLNKDSLGYNERFKSEEMYHTTKFPKAQFNYEKALGLFDQSNYTESITYYKKALEIDPSFIDAMDNLGNSYRYLGILDSAEIWYKKSIELFPKGYIAHQNLAIVYTIHPDLRTH